MKPVIFIHTNDQQLLAAKVGAYSLKARCRHPDAFEVRLLRSEGTPHLYRREGQQYFRDGRVLTWHNRDLQSFGPLRRMVPKVMGFQGRALVLDPDVFAVGDVCELLGRDMAGKAILCRQRIEWYGGMRQPLYSSAVMVLECSRLTHWRWDEEIDEIFALRVDMARWFLLMDEPPGTIGLIGEEWNHCDTLTERTKLLHNTERSTQPWKTGLPVDYDLNTPTVPRLHRSPGPRGLLRRIRQRIMPPPPRVYQPHPDARQEHFFFALLRECLERGVVTEAFLKEGIRARHVRPDAFTLLAKLRR